MKMIKHFLKGVYKSMTNRTAEVIDSAKNAIIEISEHKESKTMLSNIFIGIGVIGILIRIS